MRHKKNGITFYHTSTSAGAGGGGGGGGGSSWRTTRMMEIIVLIVVIAPAVIICPCHGAFTVHAFSTQIGNVVTTSKHTLVAHTRRTARSAGRWQKLTPHDTNSRNIHDTSSRSTTHLFHQQNEDNDHDDDDDDDHDDDDDYIDPDTLDTSEFRSRHLDTTTSSSSSSSSSKNTNNVNIAFGPGRGRSQPSQRKAMGKSGSGSATVHVCTNCGAEYVQWVGKCSTCHQWNTVQEFRVGRGGGSGGDFGVGAGGKKKKKPTSPMRPVFQQSNRKTNEGDGGIGKPASWLTGVDDFNYGYGGGGDAYSDSVPISIKDVYSQMGHDNNNGDDGDDGREFNFFQDQRIQIPNDEELNNVFGGGIMPGSLTLLGGDPGVGKSTLLLQTAGAVASLSCPPPKIGHGLGDEDPSRKGRGKTYGPVLYVSGEENSMQIASRAMRLGIDESELLLLCETDADYIAETVVSYCAGGVNEYMGWNEQQQEEEDIDNNAGSLGGSKTQSLGRRRQPSLLIIDSIQTMICDNGGSSSAGGVTQVRECVGLFLRLAKSTGVPIILVGHVTKAGGVAGPRTVEHMVDAVLYLEGSEYAGGSGGGANTLRMLRASKNRFGSSEEVGVYSSSSRTGGMLVPVSDPSSFFLANRMNQDDVEGCGISLILEGMRPMTVEVQALVTSAGGPSFVGRRTVDGIATNRLLLILAVLQKRCGISFGRQDVYVNVVGGISIKNSKQDSTSSDLAVAVALVSSLFNISVRSDTAFVGEIGLLGELRQVPSIEKRINEARRMGFSAVVIPKQKYFDPKKRNSKKGGTKTSSIQSSIRGIDCIEAENLLDAIEKGLISRIPKKKKTNPRGGYKHQQQQRRKSTKKNDHDDFIIDDDDEDDFDDFLFQ